MICQPCYSKHHEKPNGCPDCGCQHKGTVELKPPPPEPVGWGCNVCGYVFMMRDKTCVCVGPDEAEWYTIYENEI